MSPTALRALAPLALMALIFYLSAQESVGLWVAAAICSLYAVGDEIHQRYVEGRDSDPIDVLTDWAGIAVALLAISRLGARRAASRRRPTSP